MISPYYIPSIPKQYHQFLQKDFITKIKEHKECTVILPWSKQDFESLRFYVEQVAYLNYDIVISVVWWSSEDENKLIKFIYDEEVERHIKRRRFRQGDKFKKPETKEEFLEFCIKYAHNLFYWKEGTTSHHPEEGAFDELWKCIENYELEQTNT